MLRFTSDQIAFAQSKRGAMGRAEAIEFLKALDLRMSVGHWSAGDFFDRFAPVGYHSDDARRELFEFDEAKRRLR